MKLIFNHNRFVAVTDYAERHLPKAAKFNWLGTNWVTTDAKKAAKLIDYADPEAKEAIIAAGIDLGKIRKPKAALAKIEADKAESAEYLKRKAQERAEREAQWAKEREERARERQEERRKEAEEKEVFRKALLESKFVLDCDYREKDVAHANGGKWSEARQKWVCLDEDTFSKAQAAILKYRATLPKQVELTHWYYEDNIWGYGPGWAVGRLIETEGVVYRIEKVWRSRWEGDDWNSHCRAIEVTDESVIEKYRKDKADREAREAEEARLEKLERQRIEALDAIFKEIKATGEYPFNDEVTVTPDPTPDLPEPVEPPLPVDPDPDTFDGSVDPTVFAKAVLAYHEEKDGYDAAMRAYERDLERWNRRSIPEPPQPYTYRPSFDVRGEKIDICPQDIYGGGHWLVIADEHVWAVKNNGHDGDCWDLNNFRTGGAGAIGHRVPKTVELVKKINALKKDEARA